MQTQEKLLCRKDLCRFLQRSRTYIWCMEKLGFQMIGGRATLTEARVFLASNPTPMRYLQNRTKPGKTSGALN